MGGWAAVRGEEEAGGTTNVALNAPCRRFSDSRCASTAEHRRKKRTSDAHARQRCSSATVPAGFHNFFHATGKKIATEPRKWAVGTAFLAILFGSGFSQLETELRPEKLCLPSPEV